MFWPLNTEKLKIFGSVNKKFLCYIKEIYFPPNYEICFFIREAIFLEVMKCIQKFASLKNGTYFGCR